MFMFLFMVGFAFADNKKVAPPPAPFDNTICTRKVGQKQKAVLNKIRALVGC